MVGRSCWLVLFWSGCSKEYGISAVAGSEPAVNPEDFMPCDFSETGEAGMRVYDCNPVFEATDEMWFDDVPDTARIVTGSVGFYTNLVMGFPVYQIWYAGRLDRTGTTTTTDFTADWGFGTAVSENGVDWTTHADNPLVRERPGRWDQDGMNALQIARDDSRGRYVMAYQGYTFDGSSFSIGLGAAESVDGITWTFPEGPPPLDQNGPTEDGLYISWPSALYVNDGGLITAYLTAVKENSDGSLPEQVDLYAAEVSADLKEWRIFDEPVLQAGPEAYDAGAITSAAVVKLEDTLYMFYIGAEGWQEIAGGARVPIETTLNVATSATGISWTKHPENPISIDLRGRKRIGDVAAQAVGDTIHLWIQDEYAASDSDPIREAVGYYLFKPTE